MDSVTGVNMTQTASQQRSIGFSAAVSMRLNCAGTR